MHKKRAIIYLFLILVVPILYLLFKKEIESYWQSIDIIITVASWWTALILLWYTTDIKFHFLVSRFLMYFKHDYTSWMISIRYILEDRTNGISVENIFERFVRSNKTIKKKFSDAKSLEVLCENRYLINFKIQQTDYNDYELHFYTSKIVVPTKQIKKQIQEIKEMIELLEREITLTNNDQSNYDIDIEYSNKSPYYTYWVRKLPDEMISNFNFSIKLPNVEDKISVNKNHLIIKSDRYSKLFDLTYDYVSLKNP